jgi:hypothetical protein
MAAFGDATSIANPLRGEPCGDEDRTTGNAEGRASNGWATGTPPRAGGDRKQRHREDEPCGHRRSGVAATERSS